MSFSGKTLRVEIEAANSIAHLIFDNRETGANVIGAHVIAELPPAIDALKKAKPRGVIIRSEKDHFIFGADITEFLGYFSQPAEVLENWLANMNHLMNEIEDLPCPTVCLINGFALGGGMEMALTADYRLIAQDAKIGLPEVKLGIMPGWGGTVRLPRLVGADNAIEWISSGNQYKADAAFTIRAVDGVVESSKLLAKGNDLLKRAIDGELNWQEKRREKLVPLRLSQVEATMSFETSKAYIAGMAGKNYPAPLKTVMVMEKARQLNRDEAIKIESKAFVELAHSPTAENLVTVFLGDQYLKKISKKHTKEVKPTKRAAVLGAGIMGGGIAYQSASRGTPIVMKDITPQALELGLNEAQKLLGKQLERKKITVEKMAKTISSITPTLSYGDFNTVDMIVEAVVENVKVKKSVLAEVEGLVPASTILTSNTSTISITELARDLKRPEKFCGMHFFNPVHAMPLVEVIRGAKTSEETINQTVNYALQMGKTPIVVNDCPGFLVNRVLFPYFNGFNQLIADGVDYQRIDKVMEKFGWPMGPAYLMDVVGIDTGHHAAHIMAEAFPDRMKMPGKTIVQEMLEANRLGQKNSLGFYRYEMDKKGKPKKSIDPAVESIIAKVKKNNVDITDEQIIDRMMLPMVFECARCLEEKIVNSAVEVDMGLLLGLGFPPFRAGALKWASSEGLNHIIERAKKFEALGAMYKPTETMVGMAKEGRHYYSR